MKKLWGIFVVIALVVFFILPVATYADSSGVSNYTVKKGDTLYDISKKCGAGVELIAVMNDIPENAVLHIGQNLILPKDPEVEVKVEKGDTLWNLAREYSITPELLAAYNGFSVEKTLAVGTVLLVPAPNLAEEPQSISVLAAQSAAKRFESANRKVALSSRNEAVKSTSSGKSSGWYLPLKGRVTSDYGNRKSGFHHGIDVAAPTGSSIYAAKAGTVIFAGYKNYIYGNMVSIEHDNGYITHYSHMSKILAKKGDKVKAGKVIGKVGETGNATGPHLHFQINRGTGVLDPNKFINF